MKKRVARKTKRNKPRGSKLNTNSALAGAMRDLELEINRLSKEKTVSKKELDETTSAVNIDRKKERELQEKIARLIEKEAMLNEKKKKIQVKVDRLSDQISKISKIKSEMIDI